MFSTESGFEYPWAQKAWLDQHSAHWIHTEVRMKADKADWDNKLTEAEKSVVGRTLKGFTQAEVLIQDYWGSKVSRWFKKPEIQAVAATFSAFESIHQFGYSYLQEELGIRDYDSFLYEPAAKAKIDRLMAASGKTKADIAKSLAVFSAFNEGVSLFSSFAILLSFSRRNMLKGVGQIVAWSIRDEAGHSNFGCKLFNTMVEEYPEVFTQEVKDEIYDAARLTIKLEDDFIDQAFSLGPIESIDADDLKAYMRQRANMKLKQINLQPLYRNLDKDKVKNIVEWFSVLSNGVEHQDFFANTVTTYAKSVADFSNIYDKPRGLKVE